MNKWHDKAAEEQIHIALIQWINIHPKIKQYRHFIIHCPNEGKRSINFGNRLKKMGMRKGVSDLFIAIPSRTYHGAWIELKSAKGKLSVSQKQFLVDMATQSYYTNVSYSLQEAMDTISWYFEINI